MAGSREPVDLATVIMQDGFPGSMWIRERLAARLADDRPAESHDLREIVRKSVTVGEVEQPSELIIKVRAALEPVVSAFGRRSIGVGVADLAEREVRAAYWALAQAVFELRRRAGFVAGGLADLGCGPSGQFAQAG